jgi:hypothetical protein
MIDLKAAPPPPPAARPSGGAYAGYRWPGLSTVVRLPSGEHAALGADGRDGTGLAEVILRDRLGRPPGPALVEAFVAEWVRPFCRGEFVWPTAALDEWLAGAVAAGAYCGWPDGPLEIALRPDRRAHARPRPRRRPCAGAPARRIADPRAR